MNTSLSWHLENAKRKMKEIKTNKQQQLEG